MSTAAILFSFVIILALAFLAALASIWYLLAEVQRLTAPGHAGSRPRGASPAVRPGTTITSAEAAGHADAMHEISAPYMPEHAQSWPRLTERTVPIKPTGDSAPWDTRTAAQPVLTEEELAKQAKQAELAKNAAFVLSQLPDEEHATQEDFDQAMALLRERTAAELPPEPMYEPTDEQTRELYFNGAPQLEIAPELAKREVA